MSDHVRAGIVGAGFMGTVHARAIRRSGAELARVVGSSPESSRAAAGHLGSRTTTTSVDALLACTARTTDGVSPTSWALATSGS